MKTDIKTITFMVITGLALINAIFLLIGMAYQMLVS